jgi:arsenite methyltransferase
MPSLSLLPTFLREVLSRQTLPREPEPNLIMDDAAQVAAFTEAGRVDGVMAAAYLFHSARVCQVIQGRKNVLDLGCGPATQLAQIAELNPDVQFTGVDLSPTMLADAQRHIDTLRLRNVTLRLGDFTRLDEFQDGCADAIISTMALHHLPSGTELERCFATLSRVLTAGGAVYLTDFGRLKSLRSVLFFAYMNAKHQPHVFSLDYERSLRAAFLKDDLARAAKHHLPSNVTVVSTFKVPFLVTLKSGDRPLPTELQVRLKAMRKSLASRYRTDLDDLRAFFQMGGLRDDPFR